MTEQVFARIAGTGSYLPEKVLTNDDLAKLVDTSDEWIAARTGIRQRHVVAEGETTGDLAYHAAVRALEAAGVQASELDLIVLGTTTPDLIFPSNAGQPLAPSRCCNRHAVDGKIRSGVVVPRTMRSISPASTPAASIARVAAW